MSAHKFTEKMQKALRCYLADPKRNMTEAYRQAYDCSGMQEQTICARASDLFNHPIVNAAVQSANALIVREAAVDANWVLKRAVMLADFNINKFVKIGPEGLPIYDFTKATDEDWYCIEELTVDHIWKGSGEFAYEVDRVKIKTSRKTQALQLVHKLIGGPDVIIKHKGAVGLMHMDVEQYKQARRQMLNQDDC